MPTYILLGLAARPVDFEGKTWPFRGGHIGWIRFDNGKYPATWGSSDEIGMFGTEPLDDETRWRFAPECGRFTITTGEDGAAGDELAAAVADGIAGVVATMVGIRELSIAPALEPEWLERGEVRFQDLEARDGWRTPFGLPTHAKRGLWMDPERNRLAVEWVEPMLRDGDWRSTGPFPAIIYHRQSLSDMMFGPKEVQEVIEDRQARPVAPYEAAMVERAFHAGFKGIEALLGGEPSKDERRLWRRLAEVGLDPDLKIVLPDGRDDGLLTRIRRLHEVRDARSAHGGKTSDPGPPHYYDVMEVQWVLQTMVREVIRGRVSSNGKDQSGHEPS